MTDMRHRVANHDLCTLIKTLIDLLNAGIDLPWALTTTGQIISNRALQESCAQQADALLDGRNWPDVLSESHRPRWPAEFMAWVAVAVKTGAITESLQCHVDELDQARQFRQKLGQKLSYPLAVLLIALALSWFTGAQFGADSTALIVLTLGVLTATCLAAAMSVWMVIRPGGIREQRCWSHCARALALCIDAGLSWPAALATLIDDLPALWSQHVQIGQALTECLHGILQGQSICATAVSAQFPETLQRSLQLASMTGNLSCALRQAAHLLQIKQAQSVQRLTATLPAFALAMAAITLATQYALFIHPLYEQMGAIG